MNTVVDSSEHPLQRAWDAKRALRICKRGHSLPAYEGRGIVRRCGVCDRMRQLITDSKNNIGPVLLRPARLAGPKTHCPKGHPYSGANLRIGHKGDKICRTCANTSTTKWKIDKVKQGLNPYRWKPKEITIEKIERAAASGLLICEVKGRIRGAKPIASPNTLISIRQFFPERWKAISDQFKLNRTASLFANVPSAPSSRLRPAPRPIILSTCEAEELMRHVYRLMPRGIAPDHRDDAVNDLITAVLEGELDRSQLDAKAVRLFVGKQYRENHNSWGPMSLDAALDADGFSLLDTVAEGTAWTIPISTGNRVGIRRSG